MSKLRAANSLEGRGFASTGIAQSADKQCVRFGRRSNRVSAVHLGPKLGRKSAPVDNQFGGVHFFAQFPSQKISPN